VAEDAIDFWFSTGSTYTYLTVSRLPALSAAKGMRFNWRPFSVRAIMREQNNTPFAGKPVNGRAVDRILESTNIRIQLGGGIRDLATVEGWLDKGVNRVIIGTAAVRDPALVRQAAEQYPGRVATVIIAAAAFGFAIVALMIWLPGGILSIPERLRMRRVARPAVAAPDTLKEATR